MPEPISLAAVRDGRAGPADIRIAPETLRAQATVAREHGNAQLAANFERAAELTALSDDDVLAIYEQLRPFRASADELAATADRLDAAGAALNAELVREAAAQYARRGMLRP